MNDSKRNQTLSYLDTSRIADIDKTTFDIGWNACAQNVLDTLTDLSKLSPESGVLREKFNFVHSELVVYFSKLKVLE